MTIGAIDPYDVAIRVDLGEIREADLPKIFSGNAKAFAECKRHLRKLRSDRILYKELALYDLAEKLRFATDPKTMQAAIEQVVTGVEQVLKTDLENHHRRIGTAVSPFNAGDTSIHYNVFYEDKYPSKENSAYSNLTSRLLFGVDVEKNKDTITSWPRGAVPSSTYYDIKNNVKRADKIIGGVLGTGERRLIELDILKNKTIPFMAKMWGIGVIGDILVMLGKALGGNL